jgi:hypothetical protein
MAFWVPRLSTTLASVKHYIREMNASISTVPDKLAPDRHSLSDYLKVRMRRFSANAKGSICNSFVTHYRTLPDQFHNPLSEILINLFMISLRVEMDDAQEIRRFMMRYESTTTTDDWRITS